MNKLYFPILILIIFFACSSTELMNDAELSNYDFNSPTQFTLTTKLSEISGLTESLDGNLFALNDEVGIIYKLDSSTGKVLKKFFLSKWTVEADFEGIASTIDFLYAITSNGTLYKFREGENEETVKYEVQKLPFSSNFNIEGLYFDKELNGLLIACKDYPGRNYKGTRAVYLYSFVNNKVVKEPLFTISLNDLKKSNGIKNLYPSGITKHPKTGNYLILSAKGDNVIAEVNKSGQIIGVQKLSEKLHRQPEGISILEDLSILICDEAAGKKPKLTKYQYIEN